MSGLLVGTKVTRDWIRGDKDLKPKKTGYHGKMTKQQRRDKKQREKAKTPLHEDLTYS